MRVDTVLTPSAAIAMSNKGESKVLSLMEISFLLKAWRRTGIENANSGDAINLCRVAPVLCWTDLHFAIMHRWVAHHVTSIAAW